MTPIPYANVALAASAGSFDLALSQAWPSFVDCPARLATLGPFLRREANLRRGARVLDAAAGIGCESFFASRMGCQVTANEIAPEFQSHLRFGADSAGLSVTCHDWRDLREAFGDHPLDVTLLVGNSIALVLDDDVRQDIVRQLFDVCRPGGRLVIDQRNFERIRRSLAAIHDRTFKFNRKTMYCGGDVQAYPLAIGSEAMTMGYFLRGRRDPIGRLDMSSLAGEWLKLELGKAGFRVRTFYDLGLSNPQDADFITFVAERP